LRFVFSTMGLFMWMKIFIVRTYCSRKFSSKTNYCSRAFTFFSRIASFALFLEVGDNVGACPVFSSAPCLPVLVTWGPSIPRFFSR